MAKRGSIIVLSGMDGSGKSVQTELLVERLKADNREVEVTDFPQYGNWSAVFVEKYLNGCFGSADEVGPFRGSIFYALDRYAKSFEMRKWLEAGKIIVSNRYVSANQGHQGGKIKDPKERKKYLDWLDHLEFEIFRIPRPDINIFLHVPPEIGQQLVDKKAGRAYIKGRKRDIHEADLSHLKNAEASYLYMVENYPGWRKIDCVKDGRILPREEIHEMVWNIVKEFI